MFKQVSNTAYSIHNGSQWFDAKKDYCIMEKVMTNAEQNTYSPNWNQIQFLFTNLCTSKRIKILLNGASCIRFQIKKQFHKRPQEASYVQNTAYNMDNGSQCFVTKKDYCIMEKAMTNAEEQSTYHKQSKA